MKGDPVENQEERVNHPSWYTKHPSGIECIDLIEHLSCNLANAVKYIWRCGLSETPLRDLKSARWYTERERERFRIFELDDEDELLSKTEVVWRALAYRVMEADEGTLSGYLSALLDGSFKNMLAEIDAAIGALNSER